MKHSFLQRADEVAKADPKVAFYCRMYAVDQVCKISKAKPLHCNPTHIEWRAELVAAYKAYY